MRFNFRKTISVLLVAIVIQLISTSSAYSASLGPGTYTQSIVVGNLTRTFIVHVPPSYAGATTPLVLNFHGSGSTSAQQELVTGMDINSNKNGYIVVYPDAVDGHWDDGRIIQGTKNYPDIEFIQQMVPYIESELNIDKKRVYSCGLSNGSLFTERLAFQMPGTFAAVGLVAGALTKVLYQWFGRAFTPPIPIEIFHGTLDPVVPFSGGYIKDYVTAQPAGKVYSAFFTNSYWAFHNGASPDSVVQVLPIVDPINPTSVVKYTYAGSSPVVFFEEIGGAGHTWPCGLQYAPISKIGYTCYQIDGNEELWKFFKQFSK